MPTSNNDSRRGAHFGTPRKDAAPKATPLASSRIQPMVQKHQVSTRTANATRRAAERNTRRNGRGRSRMPIIAGGIFVVVAIVAVFTLFVLPRLSSPSDDGHQIEQGAQVTVTIPDGSGAAQIADILYDANVIESTSEFLATVTRMGAEQSMQSGTYQLVAGANLADIIKQLTSGPNVGGQLVIPEGYTVSQIASATEDVLGIPANEFKAQATVDNYLADYPFLASAAENSLEGYLFPKTYSFTMENPTADTVIRAMLSQYQEEVASLNMADAAAALTARYGFTVTEHDIVTMASIVEREAVTDEQRGKVASVFYNRLREGMRLQSDATLMYTLGREVTAADLEVDDPYNTYTRDGLTPTPVCNPSIDSLRAACNPDDTNYLYFYITYETEAFSETYEQHQQVIAQQNA